jgi:hypothetical protein
VHIPGTYINSAATAAADNPGAGFSQSINVETTVPFKTDVERDDQVANCYVWDLETIQHAGSALSQRGWVLQERLLSVRTVYFGNILSSECAQLGATEIFCCGVCSEAKDHVEQLSKIKSVLLCLFCVPLPWLSSLVATDVVCLHDVSLMYTCVESTHDVEGVAP